MRLLTKNLYLQVLKNSRISQFSNLSKYLCLEKSNNIIITRTVLARPKELDLLRQKVKQKKKIESETKEYPKDEEEIGPYGFFLLCIPVITFGLGVWQIGRRKWKLELIQHLQERLSREPVEIPENLEELKELDYCPLKARGQFLYDKEFIIAPRSLIVDGIGATEGKGNLISGSALNKGCYIITPFKLKDRDLIILVNRGWLPQKYKRSEERKLSHKEGEIEITGINRLTEPRPQFVPKNEPSKGMWYYRNIYEMAEYAGTAPVFIDRIESDLGPHAPIGSQTRVNIRNEHLSYIATWFGLAGFTGFYWFRIFILKKPIF